MTRERERDENDKQVGEKWLDPIISGEKNDSEGGICQEEPDQGAAAVRSEVRSKSTSGGLLVIVVGGMLLSLRSSLPSFPPPHLMIRPVLSRVFIQTLVPSIVPMLHRLPGGAGVSRK